MEGGFVNGRGENEIDVNKQAGVNLTSSNVLKKSNEDTGTHDRQHDGLSSPFASFLHVESSHKVNSRTLETEQTEFANVLIPMTSVLEVHASFRYYGNVIHIIGGDDEPVSVTANEYDTASGGTTSYLSYSGNAVDADRSIAIQKMLYKTKMCVELRSGTCQNATNCNFAHSIVELRSVRQNYEDFGLADEHKDLFDNLWGSFQIPPFESTDRTLKHCKKFYTEEGCPFGDSCTYVHDLQSKYRERTAIPLSGGGSSSMKRVRRDTSAVPPVAPPAVPAALPAWSKSAAPPSALAPQPLPAAEADATVKPLNWRTRICMKWEYSGYCRFGNKCAFAHSETELRRYGGALVNPPNQSVNVQNSVAPPGSSFVVAGSAGQLQSAEQRSDQTTWKFPKKINGIYGDWIDDIQ